jgi:hypothetical protein
MQKKEENTGKIIKKDKNAHLRRKQQITRKFSSN